MKVKICEVKRTDKSVFVKGIRCRKVNNNYYDEAVNIRFAPERWQQPQKISLPWIINVRFEKGVGAVLVNE